MSGFASGAIVLSSITVVVIIVLLLSRSRSSSTPTTSDITFKSFITWSPSFSRDNVCKGYYFPPTSIDTLGIPNYNTNTLENKNALDEFPCLRRDTINAILNTRICLSDSCTGFDGKTYTRGQEESFYAPCETETRLNDCSGVISQIYTGNGYCILPIPNIGSSVYSSVCDLQQFGQMHITYYSSSRRLCNLQNRDTRKWLIGSFDTSIFEWSLDYSDGSNVSYSWCIVPSYVDVNIRTPVAVTTQLAYVGHLDPDTIASIETATGTVSIINIIVANGCPVISSNYSSLMTDGGLLYGSNSVISNIIVPD